MRSILAEEQIQLTKSLGQNFLHDGNQLQRIIQAGEVSAKDQVLEIGPGLGPLTELLMARARSVCAIELDNRLVKFLQKRFANAPNLELINADALAYLRTNPRDWSEWKLVANLPYSVASPLLVDLALNPQGPKRLVATLQIEVAQRIIAKADGDDYGQLSLFLQLNYESSGWFKIPSGSFFPEPDVDSACITLVRRTVPLLPNELIKVFLRIVKLGFSQRRKMMLKLLRMNWPLERLSPALEAAGVSPMARAESVTLEQFVILTQMLAGSIHSE
ncbi:MAG: 16S rRNA (adenine(1518)-N(6)/adenine(1519)-N(6))-dimethyltransferase RsmA [Verrucomicrobia bacterium]|nr:16S rRNA (adenine(1518)-N(6)/adenine(1519)-N(6))-dimethyltransferase RsmA [Verrucomicrobiota bacterium]